MAAYQFRVDDITVSGENVTVKITQGSAPLPLAWQGETIITTRSEIISSLQNSESTLQGLLRDFLIVAWWKVNPSLTTPQNIKGKTATVDFTGTAGTVSIS